MPTTLLVTWATRYGSTEEVAHAVADALLKQGLTVNAQPMNDVRTLAAYDAVVLGFPLYIGRIHKDARHFLSSHRQALTQRPVALFVLGPTQANEKEWPASWNQLRKHLAKFPWFTPFATEMFGGKFDPQKLGFPFSFIPALRNLPPSDARNWPAIHAWASNLLSALQPAMTR
jgi:menaquinone-dependent protoporphyrinogen oxidase